MMPNRRAGRLSRRDLLRAGVALGAAGAGGALAGHRSLPDIAARALDAAYESPRSPFSPLDVRHVVVLCQENRSFDHYFGTLAGVAGFADPAAGRYATGPANSRPFLQTGPLTALPGWQGPVSGGNAELAPWRLVSDPPSDDGQSTNDITHDWTPQHLAWNGGAMDRWFAVHATEDRNHAPPRPSNDGYMTMGYLTRPDLDFYHALADAFTICDGYFCSVLGPTDPNRLMLMSNSVGVDQPGGPLLTTLVATRPEETGRLSWKTMPEALDDAGVSWKVYADPSADALFNVLYYFGQYREPALAGPAFTPQYPAGFAADVAAGTLPQVSWILPPAANCEHPAAPPAYGQWLVSQILLTLTSNPAVWESTVFLLVYDENGGFFDHVPPPTASPSDDGEWVSGLAGSGYVDGPVGLGFRVPCLVISPFSRGGFLCSPYRDLGGTVELDPAATFDHTSVNRLIATVFGAQGHDVALPNLSSWRRGVTGDLTTAFAGVDDLSVPALPATSMGDPNVAAQAVLDALAGTEGYAPAPYPPPTRNDFPPDPTLFDGKKLAPTYRPRG